MQINFLTKMINKISIFVLFFQLSHCPFACGQNNAPQTAPPEPQRIFKVTEDTAKSKTRSKEIDLKQTSEEMSFYIRMPKSWTPEKAAERKKKGQKSVRALLMIFSHHWNDEQLFNTLTKAGWFSYLLKFADENDLAVGVSPNFGGYNKGISGDEMTPTEYKESSKIFSERFLGWERGLRRMINYYNLPSKNIMAYGISGGAQQLHRVAMRRPEYFAGIHIHVNSSYDIPSPQASKVLWLVTTGECEYGYPAACRFYEKMVEYRYRVIFRAEPNLGHENSPETTRLSLEFFKYLLTFVPDETDPNWKPPPVDQFYMMQHPIYVGDYLNHVVYPLEKASQNIEPEHMVPLPTRPIAEKWGTIMK